MPRLDSVILEGGIDLTATAVFDLCYAISGYVFNVVPGDDALDMDHIG